MKNDSRSLVRVANRQLVLQQLFNHPATTRVDIARELKINKSTVSAIYNELNDEGFIEELGQGESTNRGGRKPNLVCLNKRYGFVALWPALKSALVICGLCSAILMARSSAMSRLHWKNAICF